MKFNPLSLVPPSATLAMNALANQKRAKGERVYNLSAGEPMLSPNEYVITAAEKAMRDGKTLYPPVAGIPELRKAASEWMNKVHSSQFTANSTLVTCGGKFGLYALFQALIEPGDKVIIPAPYWVSYPSMVEMFGGVPIVINGRLEDWKISAEQLEKIEDSRIKIIVLNNAGNPTGVLYTREEIGDILKWASDNDVIVVSDEVYGGLTYGGEFVSCASFPEYKDTVVIIQSCSKHFAMTGWRVGFVFGPEEVIKVLTNIQSQSTTGTSSISQWAAVAAFEHASEIIPWVNGEMRKRRDTLLEILNKYFNIKILVSAGLYAFVPMKALGTAETDSVKFCTNVLEKANVAMVPGAPFGCEGYVRMSFGETENELREGVEALARYIQSSGGIKTL